jgi:hypothetical protein
MRDLRRYDGMTTRFTFDVADPEQAARLEADLRDRPEIVTRHKKSQPDGRVQDNVGARFDLSAITVTHEIPVRPVMAQAAVPGVGLVRKTAIKRWLGSGVVQAAADFAESCPIPEGWSRAEVIKVVNEWMSYIPCAQWDERLGVQGTPGGRNMPKTGTTRQPDH